MTKSDKLDDLEAVRTIVSTLEQFAKEDQERIVRWALEKLGISSAPTAPPAPAASHQSPPPQTQTHAPSQLSGSSCGDIKSFVTEKSPSSDNQFAATVAYYYEFEAPPEERQESISAQELQDACRKVGRARLGDPGKTLRNAHDVGLLDKGSERGTYRVNTVGENLVAVTLPSSGSGAAPVAKKKRSTTKKKAVKKKTVKKKTSKR